MKLEQLMLVVEVAKTKSISKAADNLFMTQPGLSFSIKQLENELDTDLFVRTSKGVELTEAGDSFVAQAKKILKQIDSLENIGKDNPQQASRTLSIAAGRYRYIGPLAAALFNRHKNDGSKFVLRTGATQDCIDWVANGICDVGIVHYFLSGEKEFLKLMKKMQLQCHKIYETPLQVMIGEGHPLYHTDVTQIDAAELAKYPMITQDGTSAIDYYRSVFVNSTQNLRVVVTDTAALYEMLDSTNGYCYGFPTECMYRNFPRQHKTRSLSIRQNGKAPTAVMAWISPANMEYMPLATELLELVTDCCTKPNFWELHPDLKK